MDDAGRKSVTTPAGVMRPIVLSDFRVPQVPSAPAVMPRDPLPRQREFDDLARWRNPADLSGRLP